MRLGDDRRESRMAAIAFRTLATFFVDYGNRPSLFIGERKKQKTRLWRTATAPEMESIPPIPQILQIPLPPLSTQVST